MTTSGARFGVGLVVSRLPVQATVREVGGRLIGPLVLEGVLVRNNTFQVSARRLELEWKILAQRSRRVSIERLSLEGVDASLDIDALSTESEAVVASTARKPAAAEFPFELDIQDLQISALGFDLPTIGSVSNGTLEGSGSLGSADISLSADMDWQAIDGPSARIDLRVSVPP